MAEKPILFSTEMVRAILDGRKTQTRRVIKPQPIYHAKGDYWLVNTDYWYDKYRPSFEVLKKYSQFHPGDVLWVRETWFYEWHMHDLTEGEPDLPGGLYSHRYIYKADNPDHPVDLGVGKHGWRPSIFMPRKAARLSLRVTDVRAERVQEISEADAKAEGLRVMQRPESFGGGVRYLAPECGDRPPYWERDPRDAFMWLWDSLNAKRGYGWDANPWVWVITFEVIR